MIPMKLNKSIPVDRNRGFTLVETVVAAVVSLIVVSLVMGCFVAASRIMQRNLVEARTRQPMAHHFRLFEQAIRGAQGTNAVLIRTTYSNTNVTSTVGTCAWITNPNFGNGCASTFAIYYYNPTPSIHEAGGIYMTADLTKGNPDPTKDRLLFRNVLNFEVRQGLGQEIHLGLLGTVRGDNRGIATLPGNTILLTSSVIRRTPIGSS